MRSIVKTVSIVLFCLLLFSCAKKQAIKKTELKPYTGTVNVEVLKQLTTPGNIKSMRARIAAAVYKNGEHKGSFSGAFIYKSPDHIRISFFGPLGLSVTDLLISKELFQMYIPPKNTLYEWKSPETSLKALPDNRFRYSMEENDEVFVLYAYRSENSSTTPVAKYLFDRTYLLNRSIIFYRDGFDFVKIEFNDFNGGVPERLRMLFQNGTVMDISLHETEIDTEIPDEYFKAIEHDGKNIMPFQDVLKRFEPNR